MRRWKLHPALCAALLTAGALRATAQAPVPTSKPRRLLQQAERQAGHQSQSAARQSLEQLRALPTTPTEPRSWDETERLAYREALTLLALGDSSGASVALAARAAVSQPAYRQRLSAALNRYYFENGDWSPAIETGKDAGVANLSNEEIRDLKFRTAYAYFNNRNFAQAEGLFRAIRDVEGPYQAAGNYYYGLLSYHESRYDDALNSFERIADLPAYRTTVPYYIAEIHYFQGQREKALAEALALIGRPEKLYYDNELHLLAAQCLFEAQRYGDALPYFEHYYESVEQLRKEELYEMAYSYYRVGEFGEAIEKFKPLSAAQDSLGQTSMYLLGDSYLKTGDKRGARTAFGLCAALPFNESQREAASLLAAKLSYEAGYNEDALGFLDALQSMPAATATRGEAANLKALVLLRSGRYEEALAALATATRNADWERTYQRAAYGYGVASLRAGDYAKADSLLSLSIQHPQNKSYSTAARFWKGEASYQLGNFEEAATESRAFLDGEGTGASRIAPDATPAAAWMNLGYSYLNLKEYKQAQSAFAEARKRSSGATATDAALREADAALMQRQFAQAQNLYETASTVTGAEGDYARLQRAILLGLAGKTTEKAALLQTILQRAPASPYEPDARYELALARIADARYADAVTLLQPLTTGGPFAARALIRTGFAEGELSRDDASVAAYRRVLAEYGSSPERNAALEALRAFYTEKAQPETYASILEQYNLTNAAGAGLDSTFYAAAEGQFAAGKWAEAARSFNAYTIRFPSAANAIRAHYYAAVSYDRLADTTAALTNYAAVLNASDGDFTSLSAQRAAALAYTQGSYDDASRYFADARRTATSPAEQGAALLGLARTATAQENTVAAAVYADSLIATPQISDAVLSSAHLIRGNGRAAAADTAGAAADWEVAVLAKDPAVSAEAGYRLAAAALSAGQTERAEKLADKTIRTPGAPEVWTVRAYFLLAEIFTKQRDYFNAKATLQSIARNARSAALRSEAATLLENVIRLEKGSSKLSGE